MFVRTGSYNSGNSGLQSASPGATSFATKYRAPGRCGRYGRWSRRQRIEELLGIEPSGLDDFPDLYNITPGVNTWVVRYADGSLELRCRAARGDPLAHVRPTRGERLRPSTSCLLPWHSVTQRDSFSQSENDVPCKLLAVCNATWNAVRLTLRLGHVDVKKVFQQR